MLIKTVHTLIETIGGNLISTIFYISIQNLILVQGQKRQIYHVWTKFRLNTLLSSPYPNCNNWGKLNFDNILYLHPKFNLVHCQKRQIYHSWTKFQWTALLSSPYPCSNKWSELNLGTLFKIEFKFIITTDRLIDNGQRIDKKLF